MRAMIENNTAALASSNLSSASLNGTDLLPLSSSSGPNQSVSSLQSESKFSRSDYNMPSSNDLNFSDFGLFPSTTFGDVLQQESKWSESSINSIEAPSKTTPVSSPATVSNPHTPTTQLYTSFPFSPLIPSPKDSFDSNSSADRMESARLRTLLTTSKRIDGSSDENNISKNKHNILKGLLNPDELATQSVEDELSNHNTPLSPNVKAPMSNSSLNESPSTIKTSTTSNNNNNMLLQVGALIDKKKNCNYLNCLFFFLIFFLLYMI